MIQNIYFKNLRNGQWTFNTNTCPLKSFEIDGQSRITDREKMQEAGNWQSFNYLGSQLLHLAGDLIGDTSEEYIQRRLDFLNTICPLPGLQQNRRWGTLYIQYYGREVLMNDVTGDGYPDLPMDGSNPTVSGYTVTFKAFNPYWTGMSSGNNFLI